MNKYSNNNVKSVGRLFPSDSKRNHTGSEEFFIDPLKNKTNSISKHHEQIFAIYDNWAKPDVILVPDFTSNNILIIIPVIDETKKELNIEEMAILHLKSYTNPYQKYSEFIQFQIKLDNDKKKIDDFIKNDINSKLHVDGKKLDELFEYYKAKIQDYRKYQKDVKYNNDDFESTYVFMAKGLDSPLPDKEEIIKPHIISLCPNVIDSLNKINNNIPTLSNLFFEFKESLKPIVAENPIGLKGKCPIEEELGISSKIKHIFKRHRNVP